MENVREAIQQARNSRERKQAMQMMKKVLEQFSPAEQEGISEAEWSKLMETVIEQVEEEIRSGHAARSWAAECVGQVLRHAHSGGLPRLLPVIERLGEHVSQVLVSRATYPELQSSYLHLAESLCGTRPYAEALRGLRSVTALVRELTTRVLEGGAPAAARALAAVMAHNVLSSPEQHAIVAPVARAMAEGRLARHESQSIGAVARILLHGSAAVCRRSREEALNIALPAFSPLQRCAEGLRDRSVHVPVRCFARLCVELAMPWSWASRPLPAVADFAQCADRLVRWLCSECDDDPQIRGDAAVIADILLLNHWVHSPFLQQQQENSEEEREALEHSSLKKRMRRLDDDDDSPAHTALDRFLHRAPDEPKPSCLVDVWIRLVQQHWQRLTPSQRRQLGELALDEFRAHPSLEDPRVRAFVLSVAFEEDVDVDLPLRRKPSCEYRIKLDVVLGQLRVDCAVVSATLELLGHRSPSGSNFANTHHPLEFLNVLQRTVDEDLPTAAIDLRDEDGLLRRYFGGVREFLQLAALVVHRVGHGIPLPAESAFRVLYGGDSAAFSDCSLSHELLDETLSRDADDSMVPDDALPEEVRWLRQIRDDRPPNDENWCAPWLSRPAVHPAVQRLWARLQRRLAADLQPPGGGTRLETYASGVVAWLQAQRGSLSSRLHRLHSGWDAEGVASEVRGACAWLSVGAEMARLSAAWAKIVRPALAWLLSAVGALADQPVLLTRLCSRHLFPAVMRATAPGRTGKWSPNMVGHLRLVADRLCHPSLLRVALLVQHRFSLPGDPFPALPLPPDIHVWSLEEVHRGYGRISDFLAAYRLCDDPHSTDQWIRAICAPGKHSLARAWFARLVAPTLPTRKPLFFGSLVEKREDPMEDEDEEHEKPKQIDHEFNESDELNEESEESEEFQSYKEDTWHIGTLEWYRFHANKAQAWAQAWSQCPEWLVRERLNAPAPIDESTAMDEVWTVWARQPRIWRHKEGGGTDFWRPWLAQSASSAVAAVGVFGGARALAAIDFSAEVVRRHLPALEALARLWAVQRPGEAAALRARYATLCPNYLRELARPHALEELLRQLLRRIGHAPTYGVRFDAETVEAAVRSLCRDPTDTGRRTLLLGASRGRLTRLLLSATTWPAVHWLAETCRADRTAVVFRDSWAAVRVHADERPAEVLALAVDWMNDLLDDPPDDLAAWRAWPDWILPWLPWLASCVFSSSHSQDVANQARTLIRCLDRFLPRCLAFATSVFPPSKGERALRVLVEVLRHEEEDDESSASSIVGASEIKDKEGESREERAERWLRDSSEGLLLERVVAIVVAWGRAEVARRMEVPAEGLPALLLQPNDWDGPWHRLWEPAEEAAGSPALVWGHGVARAALARLPACAAGLTEILAAAPPDPAPPSVSLLPPDADEEEGLRALLSAALTSLVHPRTERRQKAGLALATALQHAPEGPRLWNSLDSVDQALLDPFLSSSWQYVSFASTLSSRPLSSADVPDGNDEGEEDSNHETTKVDEEEEEEEEKLKEKEDEFLRWRLAKKVVGLHPHGTSAFWQAWDGLAADDPQVAEAWLQAAAWGAIRAGSDGWRAFARSWMRALRRTRRVANARTLLDAWERLREVSMAQGPAPQHWSKRLPFSAWNPRSMAPLAIRWGRASYALLFLEHTHSHLDSNHSPDLPHDWFGEEEEEEENEHEENKGVKDKKKADLETTLEEDDFVAVLENHLDPEEVQQRREAIRSEMGAIWVDAWTSLGEEDACYEQPWAILDEDSSGSIRRRLSEFQSGWADLGQWDAPATDCKRTLRIVETALGGDGRESLRRALGELRAWQDLRTTEISAATIPSPNLLARYAGERLAQSFRALWGRGPRMAREVARLSGLVRKALPTEAAQSIVGTATAAWARSCGASAHTALAFRPPSPSSSSAVPYGWAWKWERAQALWTEKHRAEAVALAKQVASHTHGPLRAHCVVHGWAWHAQRRDADAFAALVADAVAESGVARRRVVSKAAEWAVRERAQAVQILRSQEWREGEAALAALRTEAPSHARIDEAERARVLREAERWRFHALAFLAMSLQGDENAVDAVDSFISIGFDDEFRPKDCEDQWHEAVEGWIETLPMRPFRGVARQIMSRLGRAGALELHTVERWVERLVAEGGLDDCLWMLLPLAEQPNNESAVRVLDRIRARPALLPFVRDVERVRRALMTIATAPLEKGVRQWMLPESLASVFLSSPLCGIPTAPLSIGISSPMNSPQIHSTTTAKSTQVEQEKEKDQHQDQDPEKVDDDKEKMNSSIELWMVDSSVPRIVKAHSKVTIAGGLSRPKLLDVVGSDGSTHRMVVKGRDDLRQDAVMQQMFGRVNAVLARHPESRARGLRMRTYRVVPLSPSEGVLQFVHGAAALGSLLVGDGGAGGGGAHARFRPQDWTHATCLRKMQAAQADGSWKERFRQVCAQFRPVLGRWMEERYAVPALWVQMRASYARSLATASMVGFIVGLGDRHPYNLLLDTQTAELVHIDLGVAFEQGKALRVREGVPFRLTRDLRHALGRPGTSGHFRWAAEECLRRMRDDRASLLAVVDVLLHDPLARWTAGQEDPSNKSALAHRIRLRVQAKLEGRADARGDSSSFLSIPRQLDLLLADASDPLILSQMYFGWASWL